MSERIMEGIRHRMVNVNGITIHVAEKGNEGPVVLFLHGFPELWYSWRHQIAAIGSVGYHAVAPDLRGYGDSDAPNAISSYTCFDIVGDIVCLMDRLGVEQVYLVAQDWGALVSWYLCLFRPERVKGFVCLGVPFRPRNPELKPVESMRALFGDDYYICRFQEPGEIEAEMAEIGALKVVRNIMTTRKPGPPYLPKGKAFGAHTDSSTELPSWLTEQDLAYFAAKFDKKGFTGGLNYYRNLDLNWNLTAAWTKLKVKVPVRFIVGDLDMVYTTPSVKEYINSGEFKRDVPNLEEVVVIENAGHFINQERAEEINYHILNFIKKF